MSGRLRHESPHHFSGQPPVTSICPTNGQKCDQQVAGGRRRTASGDRDVTGGRRTANGQRCDRLVAGGRRAAGGRQAARGGGQRVGGASVLTKTSTHHRGVVGIK